MEQKKNFNNIWKLVIANIIVEGKIDVVSNSHIFLNSSFSETPKGTLIALIPNWKKKVDSFI